MKNHWLIAALLTLSLIAAACGSSTEAAIDEVTETVEEVAETTEEVVEEETTTTEPEETSSQQDGELAEGELDGMVIYETLCARCHSGDGSGGRGANLQGIALENPDITLGIDKLTNGGAGMPSFGSRLSPEQMEAVTNYVWETF